MENMEMQVVESKRGKPVVLYLGYKFHQRKIYQNSDIFWTCVNRKCIGSVTTDKTITTVLKSKEHSICAPDVAKNEVETVLFNAKKRSREEILPVTQIYQQEVMNKAVDKGLDFVTQIPSFSSVKQQLYHARHASLGINSLPKHRKDVVISDKYKHFLLFDNKSDDRILIFAAECGRILERGKIFFGDGTSSCPSLFEQLYTIHMDFGSTEGKTCVWPVIYALLPNRKEVTYTEFFTALKEKIPKFSPVEFHVDFEKAAIHGIQKVFPDVKINVSEPINSNKKSNLSSL